MKSIKRRICCQEEIDRTVSILEKLKEDKMFTSYEMGDNIDVIEIEDLDQAIKEIENEST